MARRVILALAILLAAAVSLGAQGAGVFSQEPKGKLPVPDEATQKEALRLVGEVYKADYEAAKTPDQKQALARKLLQAAAEATEPANRYVLWKEARDVAAKAAGVELAFEVADAMAAAYQVDAFGMKFEVLETASRAGSSPAQLKPVVEGALALLDQAAAQDDFETTTRLGRFAVSAARRTRDPKLLSRVMARNREVEKAARAYRKVKIARETLEKNPGDPDANLTVGHYLCLVKGDWEKGLSMLALGSDEELKPLAVKELQGVSEPAAQAALGDGWWDLAQKEQGTAQNRLKDRAKLWYRRALPNLTGLVKTKVQKRLEEEKPAVAKPRKKPDHYLAPENIKNVAFLTYSPANKSWKNDASRLFQVQKVGDAYRVLCGADRQHEWKIMAFAKEDIESKKMVVSLTVERGQCGLNLRSRTFAPRPTALMIPPGGRHTFEVWIQNGIARATLNGRPAQLERNDPRHYGYFVLAVTENSSIFFHDLRFESLR